MLAHAARTLLHMVLPPRCALSGAPVDAQGMVAPGAWAQITFITPPFCRCCGEMFGFGGVEAGGGLCARCVADPPPFVTARAAIAYDGTGRDLVLSFKHADRTHAVAAFTPWLARAGAGALSGADALVPVPLHPRRILARRYNQAALMANALSGATGVPHWPRALVRTRHTPHQVGLSAGQRAANVEGAFAVRDSARAAVAGRTLVLVDDVLTSGATARSCARALLGAGARAVHVLTLARVVRL